MEPQGLEFDSTRSLPIPSKGITMNKIYLLMSDNTGSTWSHAHPISFVLTEEEAKAWVNEEKRLIDYELRHYEILNRHGLVT